MKFEEFRDEVKKKFEITVYYDREEAEKHFGSKRNAYLHGQRDALDYVVTLMGKVDCKKEVA